MKKNIKAVAQKAASAAEKQFLQEYESDMADAFASEYFGFMNLSDEEKIEWIKENDLEVYRKFMNELSMELWNARQLQMKW